MHSGRLPFVEDTLWLSYIENFRMWSKKIYSFIDNIVSLVALSMLQNGPLVHFMSEKFLDEIFANDTTPSSPALRGLQIGFKKLGIYQVNV